MITTEDFYSAFDAAGFLQTALWTPSAGGAQLSAQVRFRAAERDVLTGEQRSADYTMRFPASALPGITRGELVEISGPNLASATYRLRENPGKRIDGSELEAPLVKERPDHA